MFHDYFAATRGFPCPVCGGTDKCRLSPSRENPEKVGCYKLAEYEGRQAYKTVDDKAIGVQYWHELSPDKNWKRRKPLKPTRIKANLSPTRSPIVAPEALSGEVKAYRNRVYSRLLELLDLEDDHLADCKKWGIDPDAIRHKSLPGAEKIKPILAQLEEAFPDIRSVPGFVSGPDGGLKLAVYQPTGLIVASLDIEGNIRRLVRRDPDPEAKQNKWMPLSGHGGPSADTPCHWARLPERGQGVVVVEGERKGNRVAAKLGSSGVVGIAGVAAWKSGNLIGELKLVKPAFVGVAFDADSASNPSVARSLIELVGALQAEGFQVELWTWSVEDGKGLDDLLLACADPKIHQGELMAAWLRELAERHGLTETPRETGEAINLLAETEEAPATTESPPLPDWKPFPVDALPQVMRKFVIEAAASFPCDPAMVAIPMIVVAGSLIGTTRRIRLKRTWHEFPNLWATIIAESGSKKTPPFLLIREPLGKIHGERCREFEAIQAEHEQALELHEKNKKRAEKDPTCQVMPPPDEPTFERLFVEDTTIQALGPILKQTPRGTVLLRDELDAWLGGFERYSATSDLPLWLSLYNAQPLTNDRKGEGHLYIERALMSVYGCIQPGIFRRSLTKQMSESGLAARLLCAMPPKVPVLWNEDELQPEIEKLWRHLVEDLLELRPQETETGTTEPATIVMSDEAKAAWIEFYNAHGIEQNLARGKRAANLAKLEAVCPKLALIFSIVDRVSVRLEDTAPVAGEYMRSAIEVTRWFIAERDRIEAVLAAMDLEAEGETLTARILEIIRRSGPSGISRAEISGQLGRNRDARELGDAFCFIEARGRAVRRTESTQGRPKEIWTMPRTK